MCTQNSDETLDFPQLERGRKAEESFLLCFCFRTLRWVTALPNVRLLEGSNATGRSSSRWSPLEVTDLKGYRKVRLNPAGWHPDQQTRRSPQKAGSRDTHVVEILADGDRRPQDLSAAMLDHPLAEISESPGHLLLLKLWQPDEGFSAAG